MKVNEEEKLELHIIHKNILKMKNTWIRFVETGFLVFLAAYIIAMIPFVRRVKIITLIIVCISIALICFIGIGNRSISKCLSDYLKYRTSKRIYHYAPVGKYENKQIALKQRLEKSILLKRFKRIKDSFDKLSDRED